MKEKTIAFTALCMGFFMVILDVTIVNVALPSIANYFNTTFSGLQWVVDGYTLTFAGLLLIIGSLTDYFGAKIIFQIGLISFSLTSLGCAVSPSINTLIFFRILQGASGAFLLPPSLVLINTIYKNVNDRARAIGIWAALGGMACASGPFLGGIITSLISWRGIFIINVIIGIFSFLLIHSRCINAEKKVKGKIKIDCIGQITGFISILLLAYGFIEAGSYGWGNHIIQACFIVSAVTFAFFIINEKLVNDPMIPFRIFQNNMTLMALFVAMILNLLFYGVLFTLPFYFENSRHYSVLQTGFALLPLPALAVIGSYLGGKFTGKFGPSKIIFIGLLMASIGFFSLLVTGNTTPDYIWIALPFLAIGLGLSLTTPAMTLAAIYFVEEKHKGIASSVLNLVNQIGSLIGVAIFGTIISTAKTPISGIHLIFVITGTLFLVTACLSLVVMRNTNQKLIRIRAFD